MKFAPTGFPKRYATPPRPAEGPPAVLDAHRQTQFLLSEDLLLFERAMNLQIEIAAANQKRRDSGAAMLFAYWSRTFSHPLDACAAVCTGSYVSAPPLLRAACDCIAAQRALIAGDFEEWEEWAQAAVAQSKEHNALAVDLGRFKAASVLAEDEALGRLYRILSELSMPHFGTTVLQTAPDTTLQRAPVSFAEGSFHLAWAELSFGWLLTLARAQLQTAAESGALTVTAEQREAVSRIATETDSLLAGERRCYVEELDDGGLLFHNYRRTATGQPKRVMLRP